jgi:chemotaxis protein MotA
MAGAKKPSSKPDLASLSGVVVAVGGILVGLVMEGGKLSDVAQVTAGLIVLGGTLGAVMITTPMRILKRAFGQLGNVFLDRSASRAGAVEVIIQFATQARSKGVVSLDSQLEQLEDPFLRKALTLAVDGVEMSEIRSMMETEITLVEQDAEAEAKVFEAAGGYAPTIGIIGAVLGLIQVMKNLANIDEVGHGIAVAFVATVYGVGAANIFFLPAAGKLKARARATARLQEMLLEGVLSIVEGMNPRLIRTKLEAYHGGRETAAQKAGEKGRAAASPAPAES